MSCKRKKLVSIMVIISMSLLLPMKLLAVTLQSGAVSKSSIHLKHSHEIIINKEQASSKPDCSVFMICSDSCKESAVCANCMSACTITSLLNHATSFVFTRIHLLKTPYLISYIPETPGNVLLRPPIYLLN